MNLREARNVSVGQEQEPSSNPGRNDEILKFHALIKVPRFRVSDPKNKQVHCMICTSIILYCKCVDRPFRKISELNMENSSSCQTCKKSLNKGQKTCLDDEACRIVENRPRKNPNNSSWRKVDELSKQHLSNSNQTESSQTVGQEKEGDRKKCYKKKVYNSNEDLDQC